MRCRGLDTVRNRFLDRSITVRPSKVIHDCRIVAVTDIPTTTTSTNHHGLKHVVWYNHAGPIGKEYFWSLLTYKRWTANRTTFGSFADVDGNE